MMSLTGATPLRSLSHSAGPSYLRAREDFCSNILGSFWARELGCVIWDLGRQTSLYSRTKNNPEKKIKKRLKTTHIATSTPSETTG